jgi:lisH domain-containing protein FOPNL
MASLEDLKNVLKETLEQKGVLSDLRARIRAEVFTALDSDV